MINREFDVTPGLDALTLMAMSNLMNIPRTYFVACTRHRDEGPLLSVDAEHVETYRSRDTGDGRAGTH